MKIKPFSHASISIIALLLLALMTTMESMAQIQQPKEFSLEDLNFGGTNYRNMIPENLYTTWWGDEVIHLEMENCSIIDKKNGQETVLFTLDDINKITGSNDQNTLRHLYQCEFSYPDKPIVKLRNGQELILVDWKAKKPIAKFNRKEVQAEEFCAASGAFAFVKNHQLYVSYPQKEFGHEDVSQLTTDGSREIVYGQSVHRDEFGIEKGLFWSPDGQQLAFYRMDQSMVTDYPQVDIFNRIAQHTPDKYPMAGETSHKVTVGIYNLKTKKTIYLQTGDPTDRYFTNIAWNPDGKQIYMFELNRDQNDCRLVSYDTTTGERKGELYRETHEKYVEPLNPIIFLPWDSSKFLMQSQKDGFNHLYIFDKSGKQLKLLTTGPWVVMNVLGFNKKKKSIIYTSNEKNPIQANLYSVDVDHGKRTLLDNGIGYHNGSLSASGYYLTDNYSAPDIPRKIDLIHYSGSIPTSKNLLTASDPWTGYAIPKFECGTLKSADGTTDLFYRMVKPANFNPQKKYPTVIYVYGGPHAHNVDARWHYGSRSWETYMAQKDYILFILDNRGSENRGRDFEQATFRQLGQVEMQDQMEGVKFLKSLPYVDSDRIGVHGWSFGGFMTISLMVNYPDVFKVGVAGGPVIDWKWYEVMYGERYMDTPQSNPEGYEKTSLISRAKDLKGKLQIITGYNDATVVPQHCLSFLEACIEAGTQPDFFVYPGEPHNMQGHKSVHLHERITQYFEDYLK